MTLALSNAFALGIALALTIVELPTVLSPAKTTKKGRKKGHRARFWQSLFKAADPFGKRPACHTFENSDEGSHGAEASEGTDRPWNAH